MCVSVCEGGFLRDPRSPRRLRWWEEEGVGVGGVKEAEVGKEKKKNKKSGVNGGSSCAGGLRSG